jgi:hypothetical protein
MKKNPRACTTTLSWPGNRAHQRHCHHQSSAGHPSPHVRHHLRVSSLSSRCRGPKGEARTIYLLAVSLDGYQWEVQTF